MKRILIAIFVIALIGCGGAEERKAKYMEKARESFDAGEFEKAIIDIKNAIQIDPKDAASRFMLGEVHERKQEYQKAFQQFNKAAELDKSNVEYQAKIGTYYLLSGNNEKAKEIIDRLNEIDPNSIDKEILRASLLVREKNTDGAMEIVKKLVDENPDEIRPLLFMAQIYVNQSKHEAALGMLEKASVLNPKDTSIKNNIARMHMQLGNYDQAEAVLKEVLASEPDNYINHVKLAQFYNERGDIDSGEKVLREALDYDQKEGDVSRKLALVTYIQKARDFDSAEKEIMSMISNADDSEVNSLRLALAKMYHEAQRSEQEIGIYKEIIETGDTSSIGINAKINLAKVYINSSRPEQALEVINDALESSPNDADLLLLRATVDLSNNKLEQAIIDLRLVIKDKPEEMEAYALLVNAHLKNNEREQAKDILDKAYENNIYNPQSLLKLADLNIRLKNAEGAEKAIDAALRIEENNLNALLVKAQLLNTRKDYLAAKDIAKKLIELNPKNPEGYQLITPSMISAGQIDELYTILEEGYKSTGYNIKLLEAMVAINSGQKKYDAAYKLVNREISERGESAAAYRLLAKLNDASGKQKESIANFNKALELKNDWPDLYTELANLYVRQNDGNSAIELLEKGKEVLPLNSNIRMSLITLYEKFGQVDNAISEYESILALDPENIIVINNLASTISNYKSDKASIDRALELIEKIKDIESSAFLDTIGWVYYKSGDYDKARMAMEKVVKKDPNISIFNYHMGMIYLKLNDKINAKMFLEKAVKDAAEFNGIEEARSELKKL